MNLGRPRGGEGHMKAQKSPPGWIPRSYSSVRIHFLGVVSGLNRATRVEGALIGPVPVSRNADPWLMLDMTPFKLVRSACEIRRDFVLGHKRGFRSGQSRTSMMREGY